MCSRSGTARAISLLLGLGLVSGRGRAGGQQVIGFLSGLSILTSRVPILTLRPPLTPTNQHTAQDAHRHLGARVGVQHAPYPATRGQDFVAARGAAAHQDPRRQVQRSPRQGQPPTPGVCVCVCFFVCVSLCVFVFVCLVGCLLVCLCACAVCVHADLHSRAALLHRNQAALCGLSTSVLWRNLLLGHTAAGRAFVSSADFVGESY